MTNTTLKQHVIFDQLGNAAEVTAIQYAEDASNAYDVFVLSAPEYTVPNDRDAFNSAHMNTRGGVPFHSYEFIHPGQWLVIRADDSQIRMNTEPTYVEFEEWAAYDDAGYAIMHDEVRTDDALTQVREWLSRAARVERRRHLSNGWVSPWETITSKEA